MNSQIKSKASQGPAIVYSESAPQQQVHEQLDCANMSLDGLEEVVLRLIERLEPVSRPSSIGDDPADEEKNQLVPVAARIRYLNSRVSSLRAHLHTALSALEV